VLTELTPRPGRGRVTSLDRSVGAADVRPDGRARLDALARFIQDVGDEDSTTADVETGIWVMRRLALRIERAPKFRSVLALSTWCSGVGPRWAERRTDLALDGDVVVSAATLWAHLDPATFAPAPIPPGFDAVWGEAAAGRRVSARLSHGPAPGAAPRSVWPLRATDIDMLGHVNNTAYWAAAEEELVRRAQTRVAWAEMEFRGGLDAGDVVELHTAEHEGGFAIWFFVGDDVRASALVGSTT